MKLFTKTKTIDTLLKKEELIDILNMNIEPFKKDDSKFLFEGRINENGDFTIYPAFEYNARNQIRPIIIGSISDDNEKGALITIKFDLPSIMKRVLGFVLLINLAVCFVLYFNYFFLKWYILLTFIIVFCILVYINYVVKVKKSLTVLTRISR